MFEPLESIGERRPLPVDTALHTPYDPELASWITTSPVSKLDRRGLLSRIQSTQAAINQLFAMQYEAVAEFTRRADDRGVVGRELALALAVSPRAANTQIQLAQALTTRLPETLKAMQRGETDAYKARKIHESTAMPSDEHAREVDAIVAARIGRKDPTGLRRSTGLAVAKVDPDGYAQRREQRRAQRLVELIPQDDRMIKICADVPGATAREIDRHATRPARRVPRTEAVAGSGWPCGSRRRRAPSGRPTGSVLRERTIFGRLGKIDRTSVTAHHISDAIHEVITSTEPATWRPEPQHADPSREYSRPKGHSMGLDKLAEDLAGVVAIPVTPFDEQGVVDRPALERVLNRVVDGGIEVVITGGNTGEFYALTGEETRLAVEVTVSTVGARATVVAGVGGAMPTAIDAARHAQRAGALAVMIHQPVHPYVSATGWVDYHRTIANAVPALGVVLYLRNPRVDGTHVARLREHAPNVIAVKYAVPDPVRFAEVAGQARAAGRFTWLAGLAEAAAPSYFAHGATGFTSGLANVQPELSVRLLKALRTGDAATVQRMWHLIRPFERLRADGSSENNVSVVKEALAQLGVCRRDVRPPSHVLDEPERKQVRDILAAWEITG